MLIHTQAVPVYVIVDPERMFPRFWATAWSLSIQGMALAKNTLKRKLRHLDNFYGFCDSRFGIDTFDAAISGRDAARTQQMVEAFYLNLNTWRNVAFDAGVQIFEIELICSDAAVHRHRVEGRKADIPGVQSPTWKSVLERQYEPWESVHLVVDTAKVSVEQAVEAIMQCLPSTPSESRMV